MKYNSTNNLFLSFAVSADYGYESLIFNGIRCTIKWLIRCINVENDTWNETYFILWIMSVITCLDEPFSFSYIFAGSFRSQLIQWFGVPVRFGDRVEGKFWHFCNEALDKGLYKDIMRGYG